MLGHARAGAQPSLQGQDEEADSDSTDEQVMVIEFKALPETVQKAAQALLGGKRASRVEQIVKEGATRFEIEFQKTSGKASLTPSAAGDKLELEETLALNSIPAAILAEIQEDYPKAMPQTAELVQSITYAIRVEVDGKMVEVTALATGDIEEAVDMGEPSSGHADEEDEDDEEGD